MIEVKAPNPYINSRQDTLVFLAGSIEMGKAVRWQDRVVKFISELKTEKNYTVLNPRRSDWDDTWVQDINNPQFNQQVTWEQQGIMDADLVIFYFDPETKSPITLLELGQVTERNVILEEPDVLVCCPKGFWRKGNVDIVCKAANIPVYETLDEALEVLACLS